ncbi:MAG: carboxypeptidase-like regulatory domain-containing protein [Planctomycetaceae bacterium]|nr:carboxypeptidase-like regulatory domain-containing protein [Planctomycetaceae bacterium]
MNLKFRYLLLLLPVFSACSGCGQKLPPGIPKLYPATLTVVQDGKPLADAAVVMLDVDSSQTWAIGGTTDKNGILKLKTMGQYNGAPLGKYQVSVSKTEYPTDIVLPVEPPYGHPEAMKEYLRLKKEYEDHTFMLVDPKFSLINTTIVVELAKGNLNVIVDVSPVIHVKIPPVPQG